MQYNAWMLASRLWSLWNLNDISELNVVSQVVLLTVFCSWNTDWSITWLISVSCSGSSDVHSCLCAVVLSVKRKGWWQKQICHTRLASKQKPYLSIKHLSSSPVSLASSRNCDIQGYQINSSCNAELKILFTFISSSWQQTRTRPLLSLSSRLWPKPKSMTFTTSFSW